MSEMLKRILVAALLIPPALVMLWQGGWWLVAGLGAISILCAWEYVGMLRRTAYQPGWHWVLLAPALYLGLVLLPGWEPVLMGGAFVLAIMEGLADRDRERCLPRAALSFWGMVVTAALPALCARLGLLQQPPKALFWLVLLIWSADTAAYFVGMKWGRRRGLFPVSPNKSREGFAAGALVPFILVIILYYAGLVPDLPALLAAAFAAGIVGQLGDLAESMLKRFAGVKDSSGLFPGHGGMLDRVDSVLLAGAFLYCALMILTKVR